MIARASDLRILAKATDFALAYEKQNMTVADYCKERLTRHCVKLQIIDCAVLFLQLAGSDILFQLRERINDELRAVECLLRGPTVQINGCPPLTAAVWRLGYRDQGPSSA